MKPTVIKRSTIYLIWVIPILAIIISGIMLINQYTKMGEKVVIVFNDARGFKEGETPIKYKGILIGLVKDIAVDPKDLNKFVVTAKIKKSFAKYLTNGARFWKVSPKLKPTEITGLSTIFSGTYIEFSPATTNPEKLAKLKRKYNFKGFEEEPKTNVTYFRLFSNDGSLVEGAPVLYKKFIVGNITRRILIKKQVRYVVSIQNKFANLVKVDSHFWKISPVDIKASIPDFEFKVNNAFNFFFGGIEFDSPAGSVSICDLNRNSKEYAVCNKKGFYLYPSKGDTEYSLKKLKLVLKNASSVKSPLKVVYYKGDVAGKVVDSDYDVDRDIKYLYVRMKTRYEKYLNYKSYFWIKHISLENLSVTELLRGSYIEFSFFNKRDKIKDTYILYHSLYHSVPLPDVVKIVLIPQGNLTLDKGDTIYWGKKEVGEIYDFKIDGEKERYYAYIYANYKKLLNKKTVFFRKNAVDASFSFEGANVSVSPLKELIFGGIEIIPGDSNKLAKKFDFPIFNSRENAERYVYLNSGGLSIVLYSKTLDGIYKNLPVFYKGLKIGKVIDFEFSPDSDIFKVFVFIEKKYKNLVNDNSTFYMAKGIDLKLGLDGIKLKSNGLVSLLRGAIILQTNVKRHSKPKSFYSLKTADEFESERFVRVNLNYKDASGLKKGSAVVCKGVVVGKVKGLSLNGDNVNIAILIYKDYKYLLKKDSKFYVEKTEIKAGRVENIESSIFGSKILLIEGNSDKLAFNFNIIGENPPMTSFKDGFRFILYAKKVLSLEVGSPIYYRGVEVGSVENISFAENNREVKVICFLKDKYKTIVNSNSKFYFINPFKVKAGFIYAKVKMESLSTIVKGGIEIVNGENGKPVSYMHSFKMSYRD